MQIVTDGKKKPFKYRSEVPEKVLKDQFDHLPEDEADDYFFQYRGSWYHLSDFMIVPDGSGTELAGWAGYVSETYFSGVVIKLPKYQPETYIIGRYWT